MATYSLQHDFSELSIQDEEPLTELLMDEVANRLGSDWKRLGMQLQLKGYELDQIDCDSRRNYDKSFEALKRWKQKSPIEITRGILKLHLREINRNDIIHDVFQGNAKNIKGNTPYAPVDTVGRRSSQVVDIGEYEPTIEHLNIKNKHTLSSMLDTEHGACIRNWRDVGFAFAGDNKQLVEQIGNLNLHYAGGGNPALTFFESLSIRLPQLPLHEFMEIAEEFDRNDIVVYIRKIPERNIEFRTLPLKDKEMLAAMLNKQTPGVSDWKYFAEEFGFSHNQISDITTSIKSENSYSPTIKLLELIKQYKPGLTLQELAKVCSTLQRNDVAQFLRGVVEQVKSKRR